MSNFTVSSVDLIKQANCFATFEKETRSKKTFWRCRKIYG